MNQLMPRDWLARQWAETFARNTKHLDAAGKKAVLKALVESWQCTMGGFSPKRKQ